MGIGRLMPRRLLADGQSDLSGGLNISADASQLQPNQVRRLVNMRLTIFGGAVKRPGSRNLHATALGGASPIRGGFAWEKDDTTQQLLAIANGVLNYGTYGTAMTWTSVTTTVSSSAYPSFAAFRDGTQQCVYLADGGKLLKFDGTTLTRSTSSPNVARVWVYNQRLYAINGGDAVLYASGLNNGDDVGDTTLNGVQVPIRTFGESAIVGGVALGVSNLIFHRGGISRWTGVTQDDIAIQAGTLGVSPDVGTIVPQSIVATETEVYFLSDRGFYAVNNYGVRRISTNLDPDILGLFTTNAANLAAVHNRYYREVCWYLPNIGFYAYNYQMQAWAGPWATGYVSPVTHSCWPAVNGSGTPIVLVGTSVGFVKQMDYPGIFTDDVLSNGSGGTTVQATVQLRRLYSGNPAADKALRFIYVLANLNGSLNAALGWVTATESGSFTFMPTGGVIWDSAAMVWDAFTWGAGDSAEYRVQTSGRGPYLDVTFSDSSTNALPLVSAVRAESFDYGEAHEYL